MGYSSPVKQGHEGYVPTDVVIDDHLAEETTTTTWVEKARFQFFADLSPNSILRFKVDIDSVVVGELCHTRWMIDGAPWFYLNDSTGVYVTKTTDLSRAWRRGDLLTVEAISLNGNGKIKNIKICGTRQPLIEI